MKVENKYGYIVALIFYALRNRKDFGKVLHVSKLTAPSLLFSSILSESIPVLDHVARSFNCAAIQISDYCFKSSIDSVISNLKISEGFIQENSGIYRIVSDT